MTVTIRESGFDFTFGPRWNAIHWDTENGPYRQGIEKLKGTLRDWDLSHGQHEERTESSRAVDIVGAIDAERLVLFEIKSFLSQRGAGETAGPRSMDFGNRWRDLPLEIALKTRDTLAALVGVSVRDNPSTLAAWTRPVLPRALQVIAAIALEQEPKAPEAVRKNQRSELRDNLVRRLTWATRNVLVLDPVTDHTAFARLDVSVSRLPWSPNPGPTP